ncbi:histidine phosphatase family protein [Paenibacillus phytohabitans]|uniref:histidine phosphatase family protein n=1 Tax=Paenibacillus phytohabitans TaxID=2654978 RepID=UPI003008EF7D
MSLGLVRHFRVQHKPERTWLTGEQFNLWIQGYETAPIQQPGHKSNMQKWDICLCSDQARAVHTASYFDAQEFVYTEQLREIGIAALQLGELKLSGLRLPLSCWLVLARLSWTAGHPSQPESKAAVLQRAHMVIDSLAAKAEAAAPEGRVLIVSHGAFMKVLDRELRRRGYKAERMFFPRNGQLFLYEKN